MICALLLVLLVDVSGSISADAHRLQRAGIANALRDPAIGRAIESQPPTAITLIEWEANARTVLPWRTLATAAEASRLADQVESAPRAGLGTSTFVGEALLAGLAAFAHAPCEADRQVIDISGDGVANGGTDAGQVRDAAQRAGVTINGLPVVTPAEPRLADWYREHVVTADGFVVAAEGWDDVARAMRRKLMQEVASR